MILNKTKETALGPGRVVVTNDKSDKTVEELINKSLVANFSIQIKPCSQTVLQGGFKERGKINIQTVAVFKLASFHFCCWCFFVFFWLSSCETLWQLINLCRCLAVIRKSNDFQLKSKGCFHKRRTRELEETRL